MYRTAMSAIDVCASASDASSSIALCAAARAFGMNSFGSPNPVRILAAVP
jgi:hypothetical protein